jgi:hypothetical protein
VSPIEAGHGSPRHEIVGGNADSPQRQNVIDLLAGVTLLKGGGAIRGIGEKFSVNAATGTASMSVPLPLSPGRSGFSRQLQLGYDSGSGIGPFGFGRSLGTRTITRKADKGLPRYCDGDESDVYIRSTTRGSKASSRGSSAGPRPAGESATDGACPVPRTWFASWMGSVSENTCPVSYTGSPIRYRISHDNVTTLYDHDATSRVADPSNPARVFPWRICRSWDDKGNIALYNYVPENSASIDQTQTHEANRRSQRRANQFYIRKVQYPAIATRGPEK